jgi:hypothetical protein
MKPQLAGVLKLFSKFTQIHDLAEVDFMRSVHQRERRASLREMLPDELQHQQLVEIVIEQRSRDRIELPVVVVRASGKVDNHGAVILFNRAALSASTDQLNPTAR